MLKTLVWQPSNVDPNVSMPTVPGIVPVVRELADVTEISDILASGNACVWLDLEGATPEELALIQKEFSLHPLAIEDAARQAQRPKLEEYDDTYFMVVFAIEMNQGLVKVGNVFEVAEAEPPPRTYGWLEGTPFHLHEVDLFIGSRFLITSHSVPLPVIDKVWRRWASQPGPIEGGTGTITYRVLDAIVDEFFPVLDGIVEEVEELEQRLFTQVQKGAKNNDLRALFRIKRDLLQLRRVLGPERDAVLALSRQDIPLFDRRVTFYFQDVYDHIARLTDSLDVYQDMLTNALESYLSLVSNNLNEVMKTLTSVTVMFMVPTLIAGIYGMNFDVMPELHSNLGYPFALALMIGSAAALFIYFRRREWI